MKRRRDLVIDLTSLLDVILILLFITIYSVNGQVEKKQTALSQAEERNVQLEGELKEEQKQTAAAQAQAEQYRQAADMDAKEAAQYDAFLEQVAQLSVTCSSETDGCRVQVALDGASPREVLWKTTDSADDMKSALADILQLELSPLSRDVLLVTVTYDNTQIHRYEYQAVREVLDMQRRASTAKWIETEVQDNKDT